jgi:predicted kinase
MSAFGFARVANWFCKAAATYCHFFLAFDVWCTDTETFLPRAARLELFASLGMANVPEKFAGRLRRDINPAEWARHSALKTPHCHAAHLAAHAVGILPAVIAGARADERSVFLERLDGWGALPTQKPFANDHARVRYFLDPRKEAPWHCFDDTHFEVTIVCGLPASGKDTWLARCCSQLPVISLDALRLRHGLRADDGAARLLGLSQLTQSLRQHQPLAWNATLTERRHRRALVSLCVRYGARIHLVQVDAPTEVRHRRNAARSSNRVPSRVLLEMEHRWEPPDLTEAHRLTRIDSYKLSY